METGDYCVEGGERPDWEDGEEEDWEEGDEGEDLVWRVEGLGLLFRLVLRF